MIDCGVYKITDVETGKFYVGSTNNFKKRKADHFGDLRRQSHDNDKLQGIYNKGRKLEFSKYIVCRVEELEFFEQRCIDILKPELNIALFVSGSPMRGRKLSEEAKKAIGAKNGGERAPNAKLTKIQCDEIRASKEGTLELSIKYEVRRSTISNIRRGNTRKSELSATHEKIDFRSSGYFKVLNENLIFYILSSNDSYSKISKNTGVSKTHIARIKTGEIFLNVHPKIPRKAKSKLTNLTQEELNDIRTSTERNCVLAKKYGIDPSRISKLKSRARKAIEMGTKK